KKLNFDGAEVVSKFKMVKKKERHNNIPKLLFNKRPDNEYLKIQNHIFKTITILSPKEWLLDSSKYISRYLLLKQSKQINIKGIYVVRDVRGVINSFNKQVQTPRNPISTIIY